MSLSEELRFWAQNEEMIDQFYTQHGKDCLSAADELDRHRAYPRLVAALRWIICPPTVPHAKATQEHIDKLINANDKARALLREIGEDA